jgi:hypothetical protein
MPAPKGISIKAPATYVLGSGTAGSPMGGVEAPAIEVNIANAVRTKAAPNILANTDFILWLFIYG